MVTVSREQELVGISHQRSGKIGNGVEQLCVVLDEQVVLGVWQIFRVVSSRR